MWRGDKAVCSVRCSILEASWGGRIRPEWDRGNLIRMTELGDAEGWTCAGWEGRGLETGWKGLFLPHRDLVLTANPIQEQLLPPNADLLIAGEAACSAETWQVCWQQQEAFHHAPPPLKLPVLLKTTQLHSELINCVLAETDFGFKRHKPNCEHVGRTWMGLSYF